MVSSPHRSLLILLLACSALVPSASAQQATWGEFYSYMLPQQVVRGGSLVYLRMPNAVLAYDMQGLRLTRYYKGHRLSSSLPTALASSPDGRMLLVGYQDGALDVVEEQGTYTLYDAQRPTATKYQATLSSLAIQGQRLFALQNGWVLEFDLAQRRVVGQQRITDGPTDCRPTQLLSAQQALLAATDRGVFSIQAHNINSALFTRLGALTDNVCALVANDSSGALLAAIEVGGRFSLQLYRQGSWQPVTLPPLDSKPALASYAQGFIVTLPTTIYKVSPSGKASELATLAPSTGYPAVALRDAWVDASGQLYVATCTHGFGTLNNGHFSPIAPQSPAFDVVNSAIALDETIVLLGHPSTAKPEDSDFCLYYHDEDFTGNVYLPGLHDAFCALPVDTAQKQFLVCSRASGLTLFQRHTPRVTYDERNSALRANAQGRIAVYGGAVSADGWWWLYNPIGPEPTGQGPLVVRSPEGVWTRLPWPLTALEAPPSMAIDRNGFLWLGNSAEARVCVLDPRRYISSRGAEGVRSYDAYTAPSFHTQEVATLAFDRNNMLVIGGSTGLSTNPNRPNPLEGEELIFSTPSLQSPRKTDEMAFILGQVPIVKALVDHGNNLWLVGLHVGLVLYVQTPPAIHQYFPCDRSPIPSPNINALALTSHSGWLVVATDHGAVSLYSNSQTPQPDFSQVRIYPNPVEPDYEGLVNIDGLTENAHVKITDAAGNLVVALIANGGRAQWDGYNGRRMKVRSGVYLVFCSTPDGRLTHVDKLAVIR